MADEAAVRRVHDDGHATWLIQVAGFLVPQAPYLGPLSADWSVVETESVLGGGGGS